MTNREVLGFGEFFVVKKVQDLYFICRSINCLTLKKKGSGVTMYSLQR